MLAIASMFHGGELFGAGPGDGEQERGFACGFDVVTDGGGEGEEISGGDIVWLALNGDAYLALEHVDGDGAVGVVLLHASGVFHRDEDDSEIVLLEEGPGVVTGLPRFLLLRFGDLLEKVELRHSVDHGAVLMRGCHVRTLLFRQEVYAFRGWMRQPIRTDRADVAYTCVSLWQNGLSEGIMSLGEWISDDKGNGGGWVCAGEQGAVC